MAEDIVKVLSIDTSDGVKNINDLKNNIKLLKDRLGELTIGEQEYQDTLDELKVNQNALKDAMYATTASMGDLAKSATGTSESYNSLVHRMASLKEELRATDVSTEEGKERFKELASAVNDVNQKLKDMDALQGNFQRNVGNYESHWKGMSQKVDALDKGFKSMNGGLGAVKGGFDALSASPGVATIAILVSAVSKLAGYLKENETAMASVKKGMDALKPVTEFLSGLMETIASFLGDIITKVVEFTQGSGLFQKIIDGVVGVGNAIVQFVIAPYKAVLSAIKVFKEEGVSGWRDAIKAINNELNNGVAFKSNYQAGQQIAETIISGAKSKKNEVKNTGVELGKELAEGVKEGLTIDEILKNLAEAEKQIDADRKARLQEQKEIDAMVEEEWEQTNAEIEAYYEEEARLREMDLRDAEEKAQQKVLAMQSVASATSSILGSLADLYDANTENEVANAQKTKALRIASATIDTISGAIGALTSAAKNPGGIPGMIIGAANAATITASGMAQIAKIRATQISTSASSASSLSSSISATTSAPSIGTSIPQVAQITSASDEDRIKNASSQKVYIVASEIQSSQADIKTKVVESSF